MTLSEKINALNPETIVGLKNKYGIFWIGKAKYVFGAVSIRAWNDTEIEVIIH